MTRTKFFAGSWFGFIGKQLAILALPAVIIGCGRSENTTVSPTATVAPPTRTATMVATTTSTPVATPTSTQPSTPTATMGNASASAACEKLASCDQCFLNQRGVCISTEDCAARLTADVATCINALTGCDGQALGTCLPFGCQGTGTGLCDMTAQ